MFLCVHVHTEVSVRGLAGDKNNQIRKYDYVSDLLVHALKKVLFKKKILTNHSLLPKTGWCCLSYYLGEEWRTLGKKGQNKQMLRNTGGLTGPLKGKQVGA